MTETVQMGVETLERLGSPAGLIDGPLAAGQVSRRMLLLSAVLKETAQRCPELYADAALENACAVLAAAQRRDRLSADQVLRDPAVGSWAMECLKALREGADQGVVADHLGYFGSIALAAALRTGFPTEVMLRVRRDNTLMIPTYGLIRLDQGPAWIVARSAIHGDMQLAPPGAEPRVTVQVNGPESDQWVPLRCLTSAADGVTVTVALDDIDPYRGHHLPAVGDRMSASEVAAWRHQLDDAWELIVRRHPPYGRALATGMLSLVPLRPDGRSASLSATTRDAVGSAGLTRPDNPNSLAEALIHEHQHSLLWALMDLVPLVSDDAMQRFFAPWRSDPRPARGLLHGAYAYLGLLGFWAAGIKEEADRGRRAQFELALWRVGVRRAMTQLAVSETLTDEGQVLVRSMLGTLDEMLDIPVESDVADVAASAAHDQWLTWQLRNRIPDTEVVEQWCEAWLAGATPPAPGGYSLRSGGPRFAGSSRLSLLRAGALDPQRQAVLISDPARTGLVADADASYALGQYERASHYYQAAIDEQQDAVNAWAGLALSLRGSGDFAAGGFDRGAHLIRATHESLVARGESAIDPIALAAWATKGSEG